MNQKRYLSKGALVAMFALLGFILSNYGLYDVIGLTNESYQILVDLILGVIAALGIYNNPTTSDKF